MKRASVYKHIFVPKHTARMRINWDTGGLELLLRDKKFAKHLARVDGNLGLYIFVLKPYGSSHEFSNSAGILIIQRTLFSFRDNSSMSEFFHDHHESRVKFLKAFSVQISPFAEDGN